MNKFKKDNIFNFPTKITDMDKEVEAIVFAAAEPLSVETIESKISKRVNVIKILEKLQNHYSNQSYLIIQTIFCLLIFYHLQMKK